MSRWRRRGDGRSCEGGGGGEGSQDMGGRWKKRYVYNCVYIHIVQELAQNGMLFLFFFVSDPTGQGTHRAILHDERHKDGDEENSRLEARY